MPRRMERIRQQHQTIRELLLRNQHARLSPAIALPANKHPRLGKLRHHRDSGLQALAITSGVTGPGWTIMPELPKRQITAEHYKPRSRKGLGQRLQQRRLGIAACSVAEDHSISRRDFWPMKISSDGRIAGSVRKAFCSIHATDYLTSG